MKSMLQESEISDKIYIKISFLDHRLLEKPEVIFYLNELPPQKNHPGTYIEKFHHILSDYPENIHVFTDGSKDHSRTACAAVLNKIIHKKALPMESSIFSAEVCNIDLTLNIISRGKHNTFIILSDSLSVLTSLEYKKLENPLIVKLLSRLESMSWHEKIFLCWIRSHIGVSGNERADSAAKSSLDLRPEFISIPYTDLKPTISNFFHTKWQQRWDINIHNKLFQIQLTLWE